MKLPYVIGTILLTTLVGVALLLREGPPAIPVSGTSSFSSSTPTGISSLGSAPETNIQRPDGSEVALSEIIVRNSVINSWAAWCPFCVKELADFDDVAAARQGEVDFLIVNRGESIETGSAFLEGLGLANNSMRVFYDEDQSLYQAFGGFAMPETVFVDAERRIRFHKRGPLTKKELEDIEDLGW
ncbi:hypothetical protein CL652_01680 [bacterium]|nr:hypothetical protein [bacterium]|tara:strand:+ start:3825 stop:4379 length:555 start_codon:yes stop_codon:yes gene_type:complete